MHMVDALIAPSVAAVMYAASGITATYSIHKVKREDDFKKLPIMGIMGAFVFALQMINFTIPGTGSSGHLTGGLLLSAILGPYAGFVTMITILFIQSLLFADGGLLALGCNIWNMAFLSCFIGYLCIYKPILKNRHSKIKLMIASIVGSTLSLQLGSLCVVLETLISGTKLPFLTFVFRMQPIHFVIGLVEGIITSLILMYIYETRRELIIIDSKFNKISISKLAVILSLMVLIIAGGLTHIASTNPDGLEWSIEKAVGDDGIKVQGEVYDMAVNIQEKTAIIPDYGIKKIDNGIGTTLSGIIGSVTVAIICVLCGAGMKLKKKIRV